MSLTKFENITTADLKNRWEKSDGQSVITFYSINSLYPSFSNFWTHDAFDFTIPDWCGKFAGETISIKFSEKAIMLCKASLFDDDVMFRKIQNAKTPRDAKKLGKCCKFNQIIWNKYVCSIAKSVVYQKFAALSKQRNILLGTGDSIIAEAAPRDRIWGIGLGDKNIRCNTPSKWNGTNILGWALMEARDMLRD